MSNLFRSFSVIGLFGEYDVNIEFTNNIKIVVGENGSGKTTLLNIFYCSISDKDTDFAKLRYYDFQEIKICFGSGKNVTFNKKEVISWTTNKLPLEIKRLYRLIGQQNVESMMKDINNKESQEITEEKLSKYGINPFWFRNYVNSLNEKDEFQYNMYYKRKLILEEVSCKILYLPTYRRIEDDLYNLDVEESIKKKLTADFGIHFGMLDVENMLDTTISEIKTAYRDGFSKVLTQILLDITNNVDATSFNIQELEKNINLLPVIIDRIDNSYLSDEQKQSIRNYIVGNRFQSINSSYIYFLSKLLELYESQKQIENNLHKFKDICNNYLINKELIIDDKTLKYKIVEKKRNKREIKLSQLSSGEKQIVSIFACLLLDTSNRYLILFDEPEISLSIDWQRKLLPDICKASECIFMFAVTHSPFIFDNELDQFAVSLDNYLEEYNELY